MKKFLVISISISLFICIAITIFAMCYFNIVTKDVSLDMAKFDRVTPTIFYDSENNAINEDNYVKYEDIPSLLVNAFISIEDKKYFKHNGIDIKRMIGASIYNITHGKRAQGASTITQQLIKNTHLTNEKTFDRKLKEIRLAINLEKKFSKEQIMEKYLNTLYFGNGIHGIKDAARSIFDKNLSELSLSECATIAGVVKAPLYYSPINDIEQSTKRRNTVIREMLADNKISKRDYNDAINSKITINNKLIHSNIYNIYVKNALLEAAKILGVDTKELINNGYHIATYYNEKAQNNVFNSMTAIHDSVSDNYNNCGIIANNETHGIEAIYSKDTIDLFKYRRQVGSTIKPLVSYLPALEQGIISPATIVNDVKTSYGDYNPSNYNDYYRGKISIRDAVKYSSNMVPIELLDKIGLDISKNYLKKININIEDNGLSIALGGLKNGLTFSELLDAYCTIANHGKYSKCTFIRHIMDNNGNVIYRHNPTIDEVFSESASFLMTNMLVETAQTGTAKKLNTLPFEVASKTGTVASPSDKTTNIDAYNVSYTSKNTVLVWLGGILPNNIQGGGLPTIIARNIYNNLYNSYPEPFFVPESVEKLSFDKDSYDKYGKIILSDDDDSRSDYFDIRYLPTQIKPTAKDITLLYENNRLIIKNAKLCNVKINSINLFGNKVTYKELINISENEEIALKSSIFNHYEINIYYDDKLIKTLKIV